MSGNTHTQGEKEKKKTFPTVHFSFASQSGSHLNFLPSSRMKNANTKKRKMCLKKS